MQSIVKLVSELENVNENIKQTNIYLADLKSKKTKIEQDILDFLTIHNQPGFMYKGKIYAPKNVTTYKKKKKKDKEDEIQSVLRESGIQPDQDIIHNVFKVFKHKPILTEKLMTKNNPME